MWEEKCRRTREGPEVPDVGTARDGYTAIEARQGKPGYGTALESKPVGTTKRRYAAIEALMGKP
jgi:hypothetical protein